MGNLSPFSSSSREEEPNNPPVAEDDYYEFPHDTLLEEYAPGVMWNDWDEDPLTASLVSGPMNAQSFTFNADGSFSYEPQPLWAGSDSFSYEVSDGEYTDGATVFIEVWNGAPWAENDYYEILHDTSIEEPAPGLMWNDWDEDPITASLVTGPSDADSFTFNSDGSFTYTPTSHYAGTDSFTYRINDEIEESNIATVTIDVYNTAPWAGDDYYEMLHDRSIDEAAPGLMWNDWDAEWDPLSASLVSGPSHADSFTLNSDGSFAYTPTYHYAGTDSFTYVVNDQIEESNIATVTIEVMNFPPMENNPIEDVYHWAQDPEDYEICLWDHFEDLDDTDEQLAYTVQANTNPSVVGTSIDAGTGYLTLSFNGSTGIADLTVRATDRPGEYAETDFTVYVVEVTGYTLERQKLDGTWVPVPDAEVSWSHDTLRWTAVYEPAAAPVSSVTWLRAPWEQRGDQAAYGDFASGNPAEQENPEVGEWAIAPQVHFSGLSVQMTPPKRKVVAQITSIQWVTHGNPAEAGELVNDAFGVRFYPDATAPGGPARPKVDVLIQVEPRLPNILVVARWHDVDDWTDDDGPIDNDPDPATTDVNNADNFSQPPGGTDAWGPFCTRLTDADGKIGLCMGIGDFIQPGNNWRWAAGAREEELDRVKPLAADECTGLFFDKDEDGFHDPGEPFLDEYGSAYGIRATSTLTVWRKLHVEVDSMGPEPPGTWFAQDDQLRGDVPDPDTAALGDAFEDAFIEVLVGTTHDDSQTPWRYDFPGATEMNDYMLGANGQRGTKNDESAGYWVVYLIGIYEHFYLSLVNNDPDDETACTGLTKVAEPEWSAIPMEILRDVADDQWTWSETEKLHAWQRLVVHEVGHQFELHDDYGDFPNHVMSNHDTDAEEDLLPQVPIRFKESDLKKIRAETVSP